MFKKRLGPDPHAANGGGGGSSGLAGCPDIWELESGDFVVIGIDKTDELSSILPKTASCGPDERIVILPRNILLNAKKDIP